MKGSARCCEMFFNVDSSQLHKDHHSGSIPSCRPEALPISGRANKDVILKQ